MIQDEALDQGGINLRLHIENPQRRYKYICPEENCNLIPEILFINSDIGKIVLKCRNNHEKIMDVEDYLKILDEKKDIIPIEAPDINAQNVTEESRKLIEEKSKDLSSIINTHIKILNLQEEKPENYFHNQNVINLGNFLENESNNFFLNPSTKYYKTIEKIIKEEIEDKKTAEDNALEILKNTYYYDLERFLRTTDENELEKGLYLILKGPRVEEEYRKYLADQGFELVSILRFKNLKELNLSNNFITNLEPLNNMLLPHLEIINFSDNKIKDITPLANLLSENLSKIYLQNNEIESLEPFLDSEFPLLELLRVDGEGNRVAFETVNFKDVIAKYKHVIYYEPYRMEIWDEFNKEYQFNCHVDKYENIKKLDLGSRRKEKILIDLFPLVKFFNNIKYLILDDNKLQDVSLLSRMPLYHLDFLNLSVNVISNIKFLKELSKKAKNLKTLYLNDNKINDIKPLVKIEENAIIPIFNLESLTLKNNSLDEKDKTVIKIILMFVASNTDTDYDEDNNFRLINSNEDDEESRNENEQIAM